jgi:hypothetical protein
MYKNIYDIRCIIKLNNYFDYYNDILPLCIELKLMITYIKDRNILVIFSKSFNNRFYDKPIYKTFIKSIQEFDSVNYTNNDQVLIWKDVLNYSINYKYNNEFDKYNDEELYYMNNRFIEIENNYDLLKLPDDISSEYGELFPVIEYYHIISNKDRFEKIKNLEKEFVYIELNNEENEVLDFIKNHPKFKDYIEYIDNEIYLN